MSYEDERAYLAGHAFPQNVGNSRCPIQVFAHLRIDAARPQFLGESIEAIGEQPEIAAQEDRPGLCRERVVAPQQGAGRDHDGCKAAADSEPSDHLRSCVLMKRRVRPRVRLRCAGLKPRGRGPD